MSIAVIKTGGKQYKVKEGDILNIELLNDKKKSIEFDDILAGKKVSAEVVDNKVKGLKIKILKFKNKTRHLKKMGHRQKYTQIKITKIT